MNKPWKRKPHPEWKEHRIEDLFLCHTCKNWYPWFTFRMGKFFAIPSHNGENTYDYMNDKEDRGGRRWSCDMCIYKILYNNKIITITDNSGKLLDLDYYKD
jgi:hypothetical protein